MRRTVLGINKEYNDSRDAIFSELYSIALKDKNVVLLTVDTGAQIFKDFKKNIPEQFYNLGIAEQNAVSVAAGLSIAGKKVFLFGITNFVSLRCFEQIKIDICSMNLPVTIIGMGSGYIYPEDGPTHHMTDNIAILRTIPDMTIYSTSDYTMMANLIHTAYYLKSPCFIQFDRDLNKKYNLDYDFSDGIAILKGYKSTGYKSTENNIAIIATGVMVDSALRIAEELEETELDTCELDICVIDLYRLKPLNEKLLIDYIKDSKRIVTLEEHSIYGGIGSMICETLIKNNILIPIKIIGIPDIFHSDIGDREYMRKSDRIDVNTVTNAIINS